MKVYFIRHGQSQFNKEEKHQGPEVPLSKKGRKQAAEVAKRVKGLDVDLIYSSTSKRAVETTKVISKLTRLPIEYWEDLVEVRNPSEVIGLSIFDPKAIEIKKTIRKNWPRGNWKYSDEESFNEIKERGLRVLNHLLEKHSDQNVICVSHTLTIKLLVCLMIFKDRLTGKEFIKFRKRTWMDNTGLTVCQYRKKYGWELLTWNDSTHL